MKKQPILILVAALVALIAFGWVLSDSKDGTQTDEVNHIKDDSIGLEFDIPKNFVPIDRPSLANMNANFLYGFSSQADEDTSCIVSQTKRPKGGKVKAAYIKDGTLAEIKKTYPDVKLEDWTTVKLDNDLGVLLNLAYTKDKASFKRVELVTLDDRRTFFAYCESPSHLIDNYRSDFTTFFSSIKVSKQ